MLHIRWCCVRPVQVSYILNLCVCVWLQGSETWTSPGGRRPRAWTGSHSSQRETRLGGNHQCHGETHFTFSIWTFTSIIHTCPSLFCVVFLTHPRKALPHIISVSWWRIALRLGGSPSLGNGNRLLNKDFTKQFINACLSVNTTATKSVVCESRLMDLLLSGSM